MLVEKPLVSVIIPVYKTEKYLESSVESVVSQTYDNIEIILVDDGSPDNSPYICDKLAETYKNVQVVHKVNGGLSDARNQGMGKATGKYVFFLDSDDTIENDTIFSMVEIAENENADVVIPDRYYKCFEGKEGRELCYLFSRTNSYTNNPIKFATDVIIAQGCAWRATSVLYNNSIIKNNNCLFPLGYISEDVVFNLLFFSYAQKCSFIKKPTLNYLKRKGSITTSFNRNFFENILYIDSQAEAFMKRNAILTDDNQLKLNALLSKNFIVYLFKIYSKNGLTKAEKEALANVIFKNKRVIESTKTKMIKPYFNKKLLGFLVVIIHNLLRFKCKNLAVLLIKTINYMR